MAGRIPKNFIDDLISRIDIVDVIDRRVPLKKSGSNHSACCPFHSEKTPSFTVSQQKQFFHCFGCGAHGSAISFLMDYDHLNFVEAVEELASQAGVEVPREENDFVDKVSRKKVDDLYQLQGKVAEWFSEQLKNSPASSEAVSYLKQRGVSGEVARDYQLGFAPPGWSSLSDSLKDERLLALGLVIKKEGGGCYDRFRNRIIFPIRNRRGKAVGFGGRVLDDSLPKYLNSPETELYHKGRELYGLYEALNRVGRLKRLVVVEGYMDVIALAQFGISYAVATLGTATTAEQVGQMFRHVPELVFCFDGDSAGKKAAWKALESALAVLRDGREIRFMLMPEGEDPDSLIRGEGLECFEERVLDAQPLSEYFFEFLAGPLDIASMEGRARLVDQAKPLIDKIPSDTFRKMMKERLAQIAQVDSLLLGKELRGGKSIGRKPAADRLGQKPSAMRATITLLLNHPGLVTEIDLEGRWRLLDAPGISLLTKLIDLLATNPSINLGQILEQFRGQEEERVIQKLVTADLPAIEEEQAAIEFKAAIENLGRRRDSVRLEKLLAKAGALDESESRELTELLSRS
ncbi:MAG: DNA primase [Gammaproteobacteria bacterium]|nr:MAG: DNA primase [Gammaproteobacteria bacterium]RLA23701.1 MAG: DNA primase [Gammaproteobacteria bacterium]